MQAMKWELMAPAVETFVAKETTAPQWNVWNYSEDTKHVVSSGHTLDVQTEQ